MKPDLEFTIQDSKGVVLFRTNRRHQMNVLGKMCKYDPEVKILKFALIIYVIYLIGTVIKLMVIK